MLRAIRLAERSKPAVTDTGLTIQVPLFIKVGDKVMINTQRGEYIGRS